MRDELFGLPLGNKTDAEVISELKTWVGKEREAVTHVLHYLREVEERKLYLLEASSLHEFCMTVLKYSRHEAQARIDAMRLLKIVPEIDADLDAGRLSLTVAAQTMSSFRLEDARRKALGNELLSEEECKTVLSDLMSSSTREAERKLAAHFPDQPQFEKAKPVSKTITRIEFNADTTSMKKYERLQAYYHHQTGGSWEKLFNLLADHEIKKLDTPLRRAPGSQQNRTGYAKFESTEDHNCDCGFTQTSTGYAEPEFTQEYNGESGCPQTRTRYVRKQIHQAVWSKWEQGCDHTLANGKRCGSRKNLQKDHILEFSKGGTNTRENLRLLCGAHNRYRSDGFENLRRDCMEQAERIRTECLEQFFLEAVRTKKAVFFAHG